MRYLVTLLSLALAGCSVAKPARAPAPQSPGAAAESRPAAQRSKIKSYSSVIPATAVSDTGLFITHRVGDKLYFEIPRRELDQEMLLVSIIARNTGGNWGGTPGGNRVVRWERRGERILLRSPSYEVVADSALPIWRAVEAATHAPVIAAFDIEAWGQDSAAVIDVTKIYTSKSPEMIPRPLMTGNLERDRTFVEDVATFPENVEVSATHTYTINQRPRPQQGQPGGQQSTSVVLHWSMVKLPESPMIPRRFDKRVGYFPINKIDYGTDKHEVDRYQFIKRWRLECAVGESIPCEPVNPIVYYIDPATPEQWIPYIKQGVEDWQRAFERAGFKNAILAKDAPTDPDWSPDDARFSVVRWLPSTTPNARGPSIADPRTGEILNADIEMYHNILSLQRTWYFTQVAPLDPRAKRLPLPDSLMGRLLQYVVAHEVGHTIGLQHNMKASSMYPADSLRSVSFLKRMGHTPSIMDYARFNYVAQPEDNIPVDLLIPGVGPYDEFAVMWGYKPIPGVKAASDADPTLDSWARMQDSIPWYRFTTSDAYGAVAGEITEAIGDADAVYSTRLGIANIRRTVPMLIPATVRPGEDFSELKSLYSSLIRQWGTELQHVVAIVGSVDAQEKYGGQEGVRFTPISAARQREAVRFLSEYALRTPEFFLDQEILRRIETSGTLTQIGKVQSGVLWTLLNPDRIRRLLEFERLAQPGEEVYTVPELVSTLRSEVWSDLKASTIKIDYLRRNLQNEYLLIANSRINPPEDAGRNTPPADLGALMRGELRSLDAEIRRAIPRAADRMTREHLEMARVTIQKIFDGEIRDKRTPRVVQVS